jgi:F-type H+-transporting ATPase subunit delta
MTGICRFWIGIVKECRVAVKTSDKNAIALRYAQALLEKAGEDSTIEQVEADMTGLGRLLAESPDISAMICNPLLTRKEQLKITATLAKEAGFGQLSTHLLGVLAKNRRLNCLKAVTESFSRLLASRRGEQTALVESAAPLSERQLDLIRDMLEKTAGTHVGLSLRVDESLIGGLRITLGSQMIDNTLRRKLDRLGHKMAGPAGQTLDEVA